MIDRTFQVYIKGQDPRPHFLAIYEPMKAPPDINFGFRFTANFYYDEILNSESLNPEILSNIPLKSVDLKDGSEMQLRSVAKTRLRPEIVPVCSRGICSTQSVDRLVTELNRLKACNLKPDRVFNNRDLVLNCELFDYKTAYHKGIGAALKSVTLYMHEV